MGRRKIALRNGHFYHVYSKSIAEFKIFRFGPEYERMLETVRFYRHERKGACLAQYLRAPSSCQRDAPGQPYVQIVAYCIMPTHIHLFLEQLVNDGISDFMRLVMGSYATFFNKRASRKGPLWESRFKVKLVQTDAYALHLTRYIHLNPVSAGLIDRPEDWDFSSYREYLGEPGVDPLCDFKKIILQSQESYRRFVDDRADYQRSLQIIKSILLD